MIPKNALLQDLDTRVVYRVLDEVPSPDTNDSTAVLLVLIKLNTDNLDLRLEGKAKVAERLADGLWIAKEEVRIPINMDALSKGEARAVQRRRFVMQHLLPHGRNLFNPQVRGELARELEKAGLASRPFFYRTLRLWWQGGGGDRSLVTEFPNCGRKGERRVKDVAGKKPGRPRTVHPGVGISITTLHLKNMRLAWSKAPVGKNGRGLRSAYNWMLGARYFEDVRYVPVKTRKRTSETDVHMFGNEGTTLGNELKLEVKNYDRVPTFEQFRYHWEKEFSYAIRKLNRLERRRFERAFKPLLSGTLKEFRGPGTRYYIDATVVDVYAVSRLNPNRIVGRPTLYIVIDGFTRMIVGLYVGLEPPCWAGAMLALWNCSLDKVQYCAHYGIDIQPDEWPTGFMPLHLMADRGEMTSNMSEKLSMAFGLDVENSRAFAGEAKGVVERVFNTLQTKFGPFMPGYVDKEFSGRDASPAELRAAMDIHEITRSIVFEVLHANIRVVRGYEGWPEVVTDGTPFVPVELWHWGVENLRSDFRQFDPAYLTQNLWPTTTMKFNRNALQFFRGLYFMGTKLGEEPWFAESFAKRIEVQALFNPSDISNAILIPPNQRSGQIDIALTRRSAKFAGFSFSEIVAHSKKANQRNAQAYWENLPRQVEFEAQIHADVKKAKKRWRQERDESLSNAARRRGIKENRRDEVDSLTAEAVGLAPVLEFAPPPPAQTHTPYQAAVQDTADEVERLLAGMPGSDGAGQ